MRKVLFNLLNNWKTTAAGLGAIIVASGATISGQPVDLTLVTQVIAGIGLLFASDAGG